jgi:glucokinase
MCRDSSRSSSSKSSGQSAPAKLNAAEDALADPRAAAVVDDAARRLGAVLATLVNALDPGAVVFGGGLGLDARYRERVVAAMRPAIYDDAVRDLPVRPAALGADAG